MADSEGAGGGGGLAKLALALLAGLGLGAWAWGYSGGGGRAQVRPHGPSPQVPDGLAAHDTAAARTRAALRRARQAADPLRSSHVKEAAGDPNSMFDMSTP